MSLAPGARVLIRDEEWIVRRVDRTNTGSMAISVTGTSELVREQDFVFIDDLDDYEVLDPAKTNLVHDDSSGYQASRLYIEALLRQTPPTDDNIYVGYRAAMDQVPYQLLPAAMALEQPRPRILIADAVGLGKTLEAGILMSELIRRGRGKRILVVALKSMMTQFQKELWTRFTIPLVRLDSSGIQRVRSNIPTNHNPFYHFDRTIISIDTLKQDREYRTYIEQARWDIVVIDEAHNVADRGTGSLRSKLAQLLADKADALIMLSATPHDGKARSFASLVNMLDPTAIADPESYHKNELEGKNLFVRRFKKDIKHQVTGEFPERKIELVKAQATPTEESIFDQLTDTANEILDQRAGGGALFRTTLEKALFSSPRACSETVRNRIKRLERKDDDHTDEIESLKSLATPLDTITKDEFAKYQALLGLIERIGWTGDEADDRLVIFTERIETLKFLEENLPKDLSLKQDAVKTLYGTLSDVDQQSVVDAFGREKADVRLLIASDVASEGINLHHQCHRMIHFDIPWSLMVFQQRNGRIDRYGQRQTPHIYYLMTESDNSKIRGDTRILELLVSKEEQAYENIGDPAAIMGVYDPDEEEKVVRETIEGGMSDVEAERHFASRKDPAQTDKELDPVALLMGDIPSEDRALKKTRTPFSLFASDYEYLKSSIRYLKEHTSFDAETDFDDEKKRAEIVAPNTLRERFDLLPREARPEKDRFVLVSDKTAMMKEIERSLSEDDRWPRYHYLWEQHPIFSWVTDGVAIAFGRQEAPVMALPQGLASDETVFIVSALIPNRRGQPLLHRWFGVRYKGRDATDVTDFDELAHQIGLGSSQLSSTHRPEKIERAQRLLPEAVSYTRLWMSEQHKKFEQRLKPKLEKHLDELRRLREKHIEHVQLELEASKQAEHFKKGIEAKEMREIDRTFNEYRTWIEEAMTTEDKPYVQIVAALVSA